MKKLIYLLIAISFAACKKETKEANINFSKIYGQWEVYGLDGGIAGIHQINTSGQHILALEINSNNTLRYFNNGQPLNLESFTIEKGSWMYGADYYDIKLVNQGLDKAIFKAKSDTLVLSDEANDGFTYTYIRYHGK